jgi:LEA14-like dessication related protein
METQPGFSEVSKICRYINMRKIYLLLFALLFITCKSQPKPAEIPVEVIEPKFEVVSIYIIQADLVVTEFEAVIKIDNPNNFACVLSSIKYELYGNNYFWAGGTANNILHIPAKSSRETKFYFSMNFINTSRRLLDDVIAMRPVRYRFRGQAGMRFDISKTPDFIFNFDRSGLSEVKKRVD